MKLVVLTWILALGAADAAPIHGVYTDVCVDRETGDQEGIELQLHEAGGPIIVSLKTCEGGCDSEPTRQVSLRGNSITFLADDKYNDSSGHPAGENVRQYSGRFDGDRLILKRADLRHAEHLRRRKSASFRAFGGRPYSPNWPAPVEFCR